MEGIASALTVADQKTDQARGHVKAAIGPLAGDEDLKRQGHDDRLADEAKRAGPPLISRSPCFR